MNLRYSLIGCLLCCCWGCNNIEDAKPAERKTFIRFYEAPHNLYGVAAESVDGGIIILANETLANGGQNSILIRTDEHGERIGEDVIIPNGYANALKATADGYYIIGDSIKTNLESSEITDLQVFSARLFKLDKTGHVMNKLVMADRESTSRITDIHGDAITLDTLSGDLIILGTFKSFGASERPFIAALNPTSLDTVWSKPYEIIDRDYVNSKSLHIAPSGRLIWATALLKENQNFTRSYLGVPYVKENSTFDNFSQFGEATDQQLYANDIQPSESSAFGFGIVGTYASPTGGDGNLFFIRVDQFGSIIPGSEKFFDGESLGNNNEPVTANSSASDDTGDALISTQDGGFILAGSMSTTPNRGNGGKDIILIKVDGSGNILWNKIIGGAGDETVSSIRETDDGKLLICGSNNLSGLSSLFVMKTDKNGTLMD
jgi:hypothetical protein